MSENKEAKWYILHTYAGYENIVKANLEQMIENNNLQEQILDIKIPTEQTIEEKNGKKKAVENKTMPCYVFVKLVYSSQLWYMLTYTCRGVTGFVGPQGKAWPLDEDEVRRLRLEEVVVDFDMEIGDSVKVVNGPFEGLIGVIKSIDRAHQKTCAQYVRTGDRRRNGFCAGRGIEIVFYGRFLKASEWEKRKYFHAFHQYHISGDKNGEKSYGGCQIAAARGQSDARASRRLRIGTSRHQHSGLYQRVQRKDRGQGGIDYSRYCHYLSGQVLFVCAQNASRARAD